MLDALEVLDAALEKETGISPETRDAMQSLVEGLRAERLNPTPRPAVHDAIAEAIEEVLREDVVVPAQGSILSRIAFSGDLRLRHESNFNRDAGPDRHRQRVRFRIALGIPITDELAIGTRLVTGNPDDPNSPHHTLGTVFDKLDLSLDRVHVTYTPDWAQGARLLAGKFGNPFQRNPVYGELVWDADVQPEGALLAWKAEDLADFLSAFQLQAGAFNLLERGAGDDAAIWAGQISGTLPLDEGTSLALSSAYYHVGETSPGGSGAILADNAGNRLTDTNGDGMVDAYLSEFGILDTVAALEFSWEELPISIAAESIWNTRAEAGRDFGWPLGASVGSAREAGDFRVYYAFQVVQQDAVFSPVAQDDFLLQTNHRSHVVGLDTKLDDGVGLHLWALVSTPDTPPTGGSEDTRYRLRLDLNLSF